MKGPRLAFSVVVIVILLSVVTAIGSFNHLVALDQTVQAQWAQVESVYQRRADLIPNLVTTVKAAATFEKSTYLAVAQARAKVGQVTFSSATPNDPAAFAKFAQAQDGLSSALTHLLAVSENYPDLKASSNFADLQAQLEGSENRIAVERMRFNEAAAAFNTARESFPGVFVADAFGSRFAQKSYFQAQSGGQSVPTVKL